MEIIKLNTSNYFKAITGIYLLFLALGILVMGNSFYLESHYLRGISSLLVGLALIFLLFNITKSIERTTVIWVLFSLSLSLLFLHLTKNWAYRWSPDSNGVLAFSWSAEYLDPQKGLGIFTNAWGGGFGTMVLAYGPYFQGILRYLLIFFYVAVGLSIFLNIRNAFGVWKFFLCLLVFTSPMMIRHVFSLQSNLMTGVLFYLFLMNHDNQRGNNLYAIVSAFFLAYIAFMRLETPLISFAIVALTILINNSKQLAFIYSYVIFYVVLHTIIYGVGSNMTNHVGLDGLPNLLLLLNLSLPFVNWLFSKFSIQKRIKNKVILVSVVFGGILLLVSFLDFKSAQSTFLNMFGYKSIRRSWSVVWYVFMIYTLVKIYKFYFGKIKFSKSEYFKILSTISFFIFSFTAVLARGSYRIGTGDSMNRMLITVVLGALFIVLEIRGIKCLKVKQ